LLEKYIIQPLAWLPPWRDPR